MTLASIIEKHRDAIKPMFKPALTERNCIPIDLSLSNQEYDGLTEAQWDDAIVKDIETAHAIAAVGGYLENRSIYKNTPNFQSDQERTIHIGVDVFTSAGTPVYAPLQGKLKCYANRQEKGDYGPVIILQHQLEGILFYSLYGHLSEPSLQNLKPGMLFEAGDKLAEIGARPLNGDWPPHLHLQLIQDLQGLDDNYPGVARPSELEYYRHNCPDPSILLFA